MAINTCHSIQFTKAPLVPAQDLMFKCILEAENRIKMFMIRLRDAIL